MIELFLTSLGLTIYADAFLLAGYGSSSAASLAALTAADLARVQAVSKVPILQQHQDTILAAVHDFVQTQVSQQQPTYCCPRFVVAWHGCLSLTRHHHHHQ